LNEEIINCKSKRNSWERERQQEYKNQGRWFNR